MRVKGKKVSMNIFTTAFHNAWKISRCITWEPFVWLSMRAVLGLLGRIEDGRLVVTLMDGRRAVFGGGRGKPQVELTVLKEMFWVRLFLFADMVCLVLCMLAGWWWRGREEEREANI